MECGHQFSYLCYQKQIALKCDKTVQLLKNCCNLQYTVSCPDYQKKEYEIPKCFCSQQHIFCPHNVNGFKKEHLCNEICGVTLECGHKCQSTCQECAFGLLHKPCKQEVIIEYICGHKQYVECCQDPDFCQEKCQIQECVHKSKKCTRKCLEKCSLQITKSSCKQCENSDINELRCGHKFNNLDEIFSQQFQQNPLRLPECQTCNQPINVLKYKTSLKDIKVNQYFFAKGIKSQMKQMIQDFNITDEQMQTISDEYKVFKNYSNFFDKFRLCHLYQSIKYLKQFEKDFQEIETKDFNTQKILNTIKLQVEILQNTYLKQNQFNLSINHIRKFVNSIIFLNGMYNYFEQKLEIQFKQLLEFRTFQMPQENKYNLVIYEIFQYDKEFQLHLITSNIWTSPILMPTRMSICPNQHICQQEKTKCQLQICGQKTIQQEFYYIKPQQPY
ncbi:hypothetical protein ABPG72_014831 [Tetrahymena utriculariae]